MAADVMADSAPKTAKKGAFDAPQTSIPQKPTLCTVIRVLWPGSLSFVVHGMHPTRIKHLPLTGKRAHWLTASNSLTYNQAFGILGPEKRS
jgi:hypothetical protein